MKLTSTAFRESQIIPSRYTCEGDNVSPEINWADVPDKTESFAIIMDDPDAPAGTWLHWLIFNIPATSRGLSEHVASSKKLENGTVQGLNSFHETGYGGPCPPIGHGPHHYYFKLYALDKMLDSDPDITKEDLTETMADHILAKAQLMGLYERS